VPEVFVGVGLVPPTTVYTCVRGYRRRDLVEEQQPKRTIFAPATRPRRGPPPAKPRFGRWHDLDG